MEIENSKIFHEPYSKAYYFGPERLSRRYKEQSPDPKGTFKSISNALLKEHDGIELVFSKEMAYCVDEHFADILADGMHKFKHSFLIRDPRKAVPSLYKASVNKQLTGWDYFDPKESGFQDMYDLYHYLVKELGETPVVVDADDLLENPEEILQAYCDATGIKFNKKILEWEPGPVPDWDVWAGWHENALKSSGFKRQEKDKNKIDRAREEERLPNIVRQTIERCIPLYEELYKNRVKSNKN